MSKAIINPSSSDYVLYINWDGFAYEWYRLVNSSYEGTPHINSLLEDGVNLGAIMGSVGFLPKAAIAKEPAAEKIEREPIAS